MGSTRVRGGEITVETTAYVDVDEVLDQLSTEDLIDELRKRENGKRPVGNWTVEDFAAEMRDHLLHRRIQDALALLERYAYPKVDRIERAYREIENRKAA